MKHTKFKFIFALTLILAWTTPSAAQSGAYAELAPPSYDQFPQVTTYLDPYHGDGTFIHGLTADQITLTENGVQRPLDDFDELSPGVQLVLAINMAPPFAIQDISGQSRWGYVSNYLSDWIADNTDMESDDLSVISNDGLERTHLRDQENLLRLLDSYQPQPRETSPNLNVLAKAIDLALDPLAEEGMKRVVLFFTPPPTAEEIAALQNLTSRAQEGNVRIFSWLISAQEAFSSPGADQLKTMAEETKGRFFAFSGSETFPDLRSQFNAMRGSYLLSYNSRITSAGPHQLAISIDRDDGNINVSRELSLHIQPPNPILITPPLEIERSNPQPDQPSTPIEAYTPDTQILEMIIEFPDGHPRELNETSLLVDGEIVQTHTSPPFDRFTWDLSQYDRDQTHYLSVQAQDSLGLSKTSVQTPVKIVVNKPEPSIGNIFQQHPMGFISLAAVLLTAAVVFSLVSRGMIQPKSLFTSIQPKMSSKASSLQLGREDAQPADRVRRLQTLKNKIGLSENNAYATLYPYNAEAKKTHNRGIHLTQNDVSFGKNKEQVKTPLDHPTISDVHARLSVKAGGEITLSDEDSQAGTWVNFQQVPPGYKVTIQHGDVIHFGQLGFLFELAKKGGRNEVIITEENVS